MKPGGAGLNQIGRFLSPDPYVQVPEYSQNFNRYSYVLNNPLNGVDPSGFLLITKMFHKKMAWLKENWRTVVVIVVAVLLTIFTAGIGTAAALAAAGTTAATAAAAGTLAAFAGSMLALAVNGAFIGFVTGGLSAALAGGDLGDVLRGAVVGGISGALTAGMHAVGGTAMMNAANIVGHGIIGGLSNVAMGGKFGDGFLSAAASAATSVSGLTNPQTSSMNIVGRTAVAAAAGGTASVIGGGKFGNGAVTGAMHHLLNAEAGRKIRAYFDMKSSSLTVTDDRSVISVKADTGGDYDGITGVFTSDGKSALPKGGYYIVPDPSKRPEWFGLFAMDKTIDDFYEGPGGDSAVARSLQSRNVTGFLSGIRGQFRLHSGTRSLGCVTCFSGDASTNLKYTEINSMITKSPMYDVPVKYGDYSKTIKVYGELYAY